MLKLFPQNEQRMLRLAMWAAIAVISCATLLVAYYRFGGWLMFVVVGSLFGIYYGELVATQVQLNRRDTHQTIRSPGSTVIGRTRLHWFWRFGPDLIGYLMASTILICALTLWQHNVGAQIVGLLLMLVLLLFPVRYLARATFRLSVKRFSDARWWLFGVSAVIVLLVILLSILTLLDVAPLIKTSASSVGTVLQWMFASVISVMATVWLVGTIKLAIIIWDWAHTWVVLRENTNPSSDIRFDLEFNWKVFFPDGSTAYASKVSGFKAESVVKLGWSPPWCSLNITYDGEEQPIPCIYGMPRRFLAVMDVRDPSRRSRPA